ncbi:MAG: pilus assembly PilX family protein [Metallibacterium sp.]
MSIQRTLFAKRTKARGFVLLTALVMLLVLTLAAIVAMAMQTTQIRVAANAESAQMALAAAEGALMTDQAAALQLQYPVTPVLCAATTASWNGTTTCGATAWPTTATAAVPGVAIEQLPAVTRPGESAATGTYPGNRAPIFRITVRAANPSNQNSQAVVQSLIQ